jgi:hypothetical protein
MDRAPIFAYAKLNTRISPTDRGGRYEDPLAEALAANGYAQITGGGTGLHPSGEPEYCGIDLDVFDVANGVPFICEFLATRGAPRGSVLSYDESGKRVEVPFGFLEGVAIYMNGTDLPDDVYQKHDINEVYDEINRLLGECGDIAGYWEGPTETALYLYGYSVEEIHRLIADYMASHPLCQRARFETIA